MLGQVTHLVPVQYAAKAAPQALRREAAQPEGQKAGIALAKKLPPPLLVHGVWCDQRDPGMIPEMAEPFTDRIGVQPDVRVEDQMPGDAGARERKIVARAVPDVAMAADDLEPEPCLVRRECLGGEAVQFRGIFGAVVDQPHGGMVQQASATRVAQRDPQRLERGPQLGGIRVVDYDRDVEPV